MMTNDEQRITIALSLPTPPMMKHVHAKGHWRARYAATHPARRGAYLCAVAALGRSEPPRWKRARFVYNFYWGDARSRDPSNALAACKAYQDGLADAGIVEDDRGVFPAVGAWEIDRERPRLEIVCEEVSE